MVSKVLVSVAVFIYKVSGYMPEVIGSKLSRLSTWVVRKTVIRGMKSKCLKCNCCG